MVKCNLIMYLEGAELEIFGEKDYLPRIYVYVQEWNRWVIVYACTSFDQEVANSSSWMAVPFCFTGLPSYIVYYFLIIETSWYVLISRTSLSNYFFFLTGFFIAIITHLFFHINFRINFISSREEKKVGIFIWITLSYSCMRIYVHMHIFMDLCYLFRSAFVSFRSFLKFYSLRFYTFLISWFLKLYLLYCYCKWSFHSWFSYVGFMSCYLLNYFIVWFSCIVDSFEFVSIPSCNLKI